MGHARWKELINSLSQHRIPASFQLPDSEGLHPVQIFIDQTNPGFREHSQRYPGRGGVSILKTILNINDLLVFLAAVIFGATNAFIKLALREIDPLSFVGFRMILTSLFMWLLLRVCEKNTDTRRSDFWQFWLLGLFGYGVFHLIFTIGINYTTASDTAILMATSPLYGVILATLLGIDKVRKNMFMGILISICGIMILVSKDVSGSFRLIRPLMGNLLILVAAVSFAVYTVLAKPILGRNSPLKVNTYSLMTGTVFLLPFTLPSVTRHNWLSLSTSSWFVLLFCIIITAGVGYTLWNHGVAKIGPARTQIYQNITPVVTISFAVPLLGEAISVFQVLGALIAILGVYIARRG